MFDCRDFAVMAVDKIPQVSTLRSPLASLHLYAFLYYYQHSPEETKNNNKVNLQTRIVCVDTICLPYVIAFDSCPKIYQI